MVLGDWTATPKVIKEAGESNNFSNFKINSSGKKVDKKTWWNKGGV